MLSMRHKLPGGAERVSNSGAGELLADLGRGAWALSDALDWQRDDRLRHLHGGTDWEEVFLGSARFSVAGLADVFG